MNKANKVIAVIITLLIIASAFVICNFSKKSYSQNVKDGINASISSVKIVDEKDENSKDIIDSFNSTYSGKSINELEVYYGTDKTISAEDKEKVLNLDDYNLYAVNFETTNNLKYEVYYFVSNIIYESYILVPQDMPDMISPKSTEKSDSIELLFPKEMSELEVRQALSKTGIKIEFSCYKENPNPNKGAKYSFEKTVV